MEIHWASSLARLDARIEREILRLRARYELSLDEFRGLYVSDEHVDRLLAEGRTGFAPEIFPPIPRPGTRPGDSPWRHLVQTFDLSPLDEDLLVIAAAPEFDLKYETLYAYLNNDVTRKWPTADLARRLLADVAETSGIVEALAPGSTLHRRRLLQRIEPLSGRPASLNAGFVLHPCVTQWVHGRAPALALDSSAISWTSGAHLPRVDDAARTRAEPVVRLCRSSRRDVMPVIALLGQTGSGRTATALAVAAAGGVPLIHVDLRALADAHGEAVDTLDRLTLVVALQPAVVLVDGFDAPGDDEQRRVRNEGRLARVVSLWLPCSLVLFRTSDDERWRPYAGRCRTLEVRCDVDTYADRMALWRDAAQARGLRMGEAELHSLAGRFALTPGQIRATVATGLDLATMSGAVGVVAPGQVAAAARLTSDQALGRLATKVERKHDWGDLVLPPATLRRLRELASAIRDRHIVYGEWGFGKRLITGTGIRALFAGVSGTGKTMAAGVIANELGLDLYKIDLSSVVSKYIGETEKNLDRIFRAARAANAIVFLDEAEALIGKRSEVKDAHDRYANIEIAYLLQKLEEDGLFILATNLKRNIDDAFNRRIQYVIDFPRPQETERERIWRGMFPALSPLDPDVNFGFLARQFDLAGGDIRNVALDAAFLAAQDGGVIGMSAIVEALARQLAKQGKTPTGSEFGPYQALLPAAVGRDAH